MIRLIIIRTILVMSSLLKAWKTIVSSMRLMNSGRNARFSSSSTRSFIFSWVLSSPSGRKPGETRLPMKLVPRLEVMIRIVFLKSTTWPTESVRRPSSSTWSSMLNTSGWAFSISSKSTTEYGRRRTFSVR